MLCVECHLRETEPWSVWCPACRVLMVPAPESVAFLDAAIFELGDRVVEDAHAAVEGYALARIGADFDAAIDRVARARLVGGNPAL